MLAVVMSVSVGVFCAVLVYRVQSQGHARRRVQYEMHELVRSLRTKQERHQVNDTLVERHLPELSETLALGIRAGLSFDRSFGLYCDRFDDDLARLCRKALQRWEGGFMTREEALNAMAQESASELLQRLVVNINRSLKLGGSMARTLEVLSSEARSCHKAKVEERIARVPVKMMIPTAVCILPSMLIVILGPVVLGMMN